jgi:predicted kinase
MEQNKYIIAFLGHPCTGKSATARTLAERVSDIYLVSTDKQKWLLSGYDRNTHPVPIKEITLGLFEAVCKTGFPIQLEYIRTEEDYRTTLALAEQYGYKLHCFEFRAPLELLLKRFHERVADAKATGKKISVKTEDVFLKNIEMGYYAPADAIVFQTAEMTSEEIVEEVLRHIGTDTLFKEHTQK